MVRLRTRVPDALEEGTGVEDTAQARSSRFRNEAIHFAVKTYEVFLASSVRVPGTAGTYAAWVRCNGKGGETLDVYFQDGSTSRLVNTVDTAARSGTLFLPSGRLPWVVDLLRNEGPVYAYLNHSRPELNRLHTGLEPVGQGEVAHR